MTEKKKSSENLWHTNFRIWFYDAKVFLKNFFDGKIWKFEKI